MATNICAFITQQQSPSPDLTPHLLLSTNYTSSPSSVSMLNRITYAYIAPVIICFGIIGDILTVATLTHPLLRKASIIYTYLTLLALTDLLTQLSVMPMILWLLEMRLCSPASVFYYAHIGFPLANALMGTSVWLVVFLTLSQYMAVCHPFRQGYLRRRRMSLILYGIAFILSFAIHAPWATKKSVHAIPRGLMKCSLVICDRQIEHWFRFYEWAREFLTRVLPFLLIAYFNAMILVTYRTTKRDRMRRLTTHKRTHCGEKEERRLFSLLFTVIILFFMCTIPAAPLTILVADKHSQNLSFQIFRAVTNLLEFTKFALNFYFYCLINPDIRRICLSIVRCDELGRPARVKGQPTIPISVYTKSTKNSTIRYINTPIGTMNNSSRRCSSRLMLQDSLRRSSMISLMTAAGSRTRSASTMLFDPNAINIANHTHSLSPTGTTTRIITNPLQHEHEERTFNGKIGDESPDILLIDL